MRPRLRLKSKMQLKCLWLVISQFVFCYGGMAQNDFPAVEFVEVKGGTFNMGDEFAMGRVNEKPVHKVILKSFQLSKYEITNVQFCVFLNVFGNKLEGGGKWVDIESPYGNIKMVKSKYVSKSGKENHPVIEVSRFGAKAFAEWMGARLPTEAEWEYAARNGGKSVRFTTGMDVTGDQANLKRTFGKDQWDGTSPVGSFPPNEFGLYDMCGNVWEWCSDFYGDYIDESMVNPKGTTTEGPVVRGGSWSFRMDYATVTYRVWEVPAYWSYDNGFRVARDVDAN